MAFSNLFTRMLRRASRPQSTVRRKPSPINLMIDKLEDRWVPTAVVLSGPVYDQTTATSYTTIHEALTALTPGSNDTITVAAGTYTDNAIVPTGLSGLTLESATQYEIQHGAGSSGQTTGIVTIKTAGTDPYDLAGNSTLVLVQSSNVTINGFILNGSNGNSSPIPGINAARGITNYALPGAETEIANLTIVNNTISNVAGDAISIDNNGDTGLGGTISNNTISAYGGWSAQAPWAGIFLGDNSTANVTNNNITVPFDGGKGFNYGIQLDALYNAPAPTTISNNNMTVGGLGAGIFINDIFPEPNVGTITVANNGFTTTGSGTTTQQTRGITVYSVFGVNVALTNNIVGSQTLGGPFTQPAGKYFDRGIDLWNVGSTVSVTGGSISNSTTGLQVDGVDTYYGAGNSVGSTVGISGVSISGLITGVKVTNVANATSPISSPNGNVSVAITNGSLSGTSGGALNVQAAASQSYYANVTLTGIIPITGGLNQTAGSNKSNIYDTLGNASIAFEPNLSGSGVAGNPIGVGPIGFQDVSGNFTYTNNANGTPNTGGGFLTPVSNYTAANPVAANPLGNYLVYGYTASPGTFAINEAAGTYNLVFTVGANTQNQLSNTTVTVKSGATTLNTPTTTINTSGKTANYSTTVTLATAGRLDFVFSSPTSNPWTADGVQITKVPPPPPA